jgi:hypothetical protein
MTLRYESARTQEQVETTATSVAAEVRQNLSRVLQSLQALMWRNPLNRWP